MKTGAHYSSSGACEFTVWAPARKSVSLHVVYPVDQLIPLQKDPDGFWKTIRNSIHPGTRYFYQLDGVLERPDPASHYQPEGVHGPSEVVNHEFPWSDDLWVGLPLSDLVMYEMHIGTFTPEGTFEAARGRLRELASIGVNAVSLMPVAAFPGERNWGYDGAYPFAVHHAYGGPAGLKHFINACHGCGIAVFLDVVYNHLGPEGNYLADFAPYFTHRYQTPWGDAINYDERYSENVRGYFLENALYWLKEYHVDGLRLDAVHGIFDKSVQHILSELSEVVEKFSVLSGHIHYLVAESDSNDPILIRPRKSGGYGIDAQWCDDFHHSLHALLTRERRGYYVDFGTIENLKKSFEEGFVYSGQFSAFRKNPHGISSRDVPAAGFIVFSQNHDQVGNRASGNRLSTLVDFEALKLAAGAVFVSPYIPLIFMGEEYCEEAPFFYFVDHSDQALNKAVREGRVREFKSFAWEVEPPDPQDPATFLESRISWQKRGSGKHKVMLDFYRLLISLRKSIPALSHLSKDGMFAVVEPGHDILTVRRQFRESFIVCVMNFERESVHVVLNFPSGAWHKRLDSSETVWMGPGTGLPETIEGETAVLMKPLSLVLYERKGV